MIRWIFLTAICLLPSLLKAQHVIEGVVSDRQGLAVNAYITVCPKGNSSIIGFADTDSKGYYQIKYHTDADSVVVVASGLNIGRHVRIVPNRSQTLDFRVNSKTFQIKEVSVRAKKIEQRGDTIKYNVAAYRQQGDRVIKDVLEKMPGLEITQSGGIKFNGIEIKKFYIEDMDLLQGRYGIATNNINTADVVSVEVLQNHQPIKMLQNKVFSSDVAINLKLKDAAKGTFAINTTLGGGVQADNHWNIRKRPLVVGEKQIGSNPLWNAQAVGMYFSKKRQNIVLYKGNNMGDNVSAELTSHYSDENGINLYAFSPINAIMPSGAGLPQKRTFDNHSHLISVNHLEKLKNDAEMNINVHWYNDRIRREGLSEQNLFLSDNQRLNTSETLVSETKMNNLNALFRYINNNDNGFWSNVLTFDGNWNKDEVLSLLSTTYRPQLPSQTQHNEQVGQSFRRPLFSIKNTFNVIRRMGKNIFNLHFSAGYEQKPNILEVQVDSIEQHSLQHYEQDLDSRHMAAKFYTDYAIQLGYFKLAYGVIAQTDWRKIKTELDGFDVPLDGSESEKKDWLRNDLWYKTTELTFGQEYKFERAGWRISLGCPLHLYMQSLEDKVRKSYDNYTHLLITPRFTTLYEWKNWTVNTQLSYSRTIGTPEGIYDGYLMNNYRSFQRTYLDRLSETNRMGGNVGLSYRHVLSALFLRMNAGYNLTSDNQIYGYNYQGATSVVEAVDRHTKTTNYNVGIDLSKGFNVMQATLRLFGGYMGSRSERLINQQVYPYRTATIRFGVGGTITPLPWLNMVLSSGYNWGRTYTDGTNKGRLLRSATQRLKTNVFVTKKLTFSAVVEDNYNNLTVVNRHAWFGDLQAKYKLKHVDFDIELNNLFNQRSYTHVTYNGPDIFMNTTQLRPLHVSFKVTFKLL